MARQYATVPGSSIEIIEKPPAGKVRHAVLDFDGTLSMVRDGWQDIMVPMMVDVLAACPGAESRDELERKVVGFVDHLTGKQTIYQMIRLADEVRARGGQPLEPLEYKRQYNERIVPVARERLRDLREGREPPEKWLVRGSLELLDGLRERGVRLYLASGTDVEYVRDEARTLRIAEYFDGGIFGALSNYRDFSKEKVIRQILADHDLRGPELVVIGDGYVEIVNGRSVEAIAVGLASAEGNRYHMNADKRERLIRAGAHLILEPDLREAPALIDYLLPR